MLAAVQHCVTIRPNNIAKHKKEGEDFVTNQAFLLYTSAILFGEGIVNINVGICKCNTFEIFMRKL